MRALTWLLILVLGVLLSCIAGRARAEEAVYKDGDLTVRLTQDACDVPELAEALTAAESQTPAKKAIIRVGKTEIPACWGTYEDKALVADILGHAGFVLMRDFKDDPGV